MPNSPERTLIQIVWINYATSAKSLLVPQADDRPFDQYLPFRDAVYAVVLSDRFLNELETAWKPFTEQSLAQIGNALILELQALPLAMEVSQATQKPEEAKAWWKKMLGRCSTGAESVKDILKDPPPYVKYGVTLFKEAIDLWKGKE